MPYGTMSTLTERLLREADVDLDRLLWTAPEDAPEDAEAPYRLSVVIGGALDEEFDVRRYWRGSIAVDVLAADLRDDERIDEPWSVALYDTAAAEDVYSRAGGREV